MRNAFLVLAMLLWAAQSRPPDIAFRMHPIDLGASETAAVADVNRDGRLDIISGEAWYDAAKGWRKHRFRELGFSNQYIDNFSDLALDVDADGYPDIVSVSWFAKKVAWWRNPGKAGGEWKEATINSGFNVEFAILADVDNDGKAHEVVAQENGTGQSWYEVSARGPSEARSGRASASGGGAPRALVDDKGWIKHVISDRTYGHGIGAGDVNNDKRTDVLTPRGWLEAPEDPRTGPWKFHAVWESMNTPPTPPSAPPTEGAPPRVAELGFMHVLEVNGDGRPDVVTAAGHDFGVYWFEQGEGGRWTRRVIDNAWSQGHASTLVDVNRDGRPDLITGKRFMAHNGSDPGEREPLGVYWYERLPKAPGGPVEWVRHLVDFGGRMGGGMQLPAVDIDGDGDIDLVCPGKSGLFLAENLTKAPGNR
jgi:FG-GAP-like repeat